MATVGRWLALGGTALLLAAAVAPLLGRFRLSGRLLIAGATVLGAATVVLAVALVRVDPTIAYVVDHSQHDTAWWWRLAGLWGGTEGSLLLFATVLAILAAAATATLDVASRPGSRAQDARTTPGHSSATVALMAAVVAWVAATSAAVADPFATLDLPAVDGTGLVPILEHWAMLVHPPLTYLGLAALIVPGSVGIVALWRGGAALDEPALDRLLVRWLRLSWLLLVAAMALGARWAYAELGWGGWWAWDAVENTSLVPWLAVTAALHLLRRRHAPPPVAHADVSDPERSTPTGSGALGPAALSAVALVLAMAGTTLTRSGAASSVHAFAEATDVGQGLGALTSVLALATAAASTRAWAHQRRDLPHDGRSWLDVAAGLLTATCAVVAVGTLVPLVRRSTGEGPTSTDPAFFARFTTPLTWALLVSLAASSLPSEGSGHYFRHHVSEIVPRSRLWGWIAAAVVGGATAALAVAWAGGSATGLVTAALAGAAGGGTLAGIAGDDAPAGAAGAGGPAATSAAGAGGPAAAGAAGDGSAAAAARQVRRHRVGASTVAHVGVAVLLVGAAAGTGSTTATVALDVGESATVGDLTVRNEGAHVDPDSPEDRPVVVAPTEVSGGGPSTVLRPAVVGYPQLGARLAESATRSTWRGDVQLLLLRADDGGGAVLEVRTRPLLWLVWAGAALLVGAGAALGARTARPTLDRGSVTVAERAQGLRGEGA